MRSSLSLLGLVLVPCLFSSEPDKVFDPPRIPQDARLKQKHLDAPAAFNPKNHTKETWEARAAQLRKQILVSQGLWPIPEKKPLDVTIHGKIDRDDYTVEKVYFQSMPGHYVCGSLYRPKNKTGKLPVVLSPHGHFNNGRFFEESQAGINRDLKSGGEKRPDGAKYPLQATCVGLCRLGCIVFHYDMVGNADSKPIPHTQGFNSIDAELRLQNFMGLQTWNSIRALDFVLSLPEADATRVGCTGASGGGTQTFILGAIDPRVTVAFPAVMVSMNMQGGCVCENSSLLRVGTNNVEIAALFAPRPLAMTGANDWTQDIETRGLPELKHIYGLYSAADKVHAKYYSFPHNYNQVSREMLYEWFNKHFSLGASSPIVEKEFLPIPPKDLSVFEKLPADFLPADQLRQKMTATNEAEMTGLIKNVRLHREVMHTAWSTLCSTSFPAKGSTSATKLGTEPGDNYYIWKGTNSLTGSGEEIPVIAIVPKQINGKALVWAAEEGKAVAFSEGKLKPEVKQLIDAGTTVVIPDLYLTGEWHPPGKKTATPTVAQIHHKTVPFLGYWFGYNRSVFAERVHDLLTVAGHLKNRTDVKEIQLLGTGKMGPVAVIAGSIAGDGIGRVAADLNGLSFTNVTRPDDEMLLPGALKYGGLGGALWLRKVDQTKLIHVEPALVSPPSRIAEGSLRELLDWLSK